MLAPKCPAPKRTGPFSQSGDWSITKLEKLHPLLESLASLGIIRVHLRVLLKSLNTPVLSWSEGLQWRPQLIPHDAERRQSLGQLYIWSRLFFQSGNLLIRASEIGWRSWCYIVKGFTKIYKCVYFAKCFQIIPTCLVCDFTWVIIASCVTTK